MRKDPYPKLEPGKCYHIYNRGNNKETLFKEPQNYHYFLYLWRKHIEPVAKTFCYSLLPNHFHFFICMNESNGEMPAKAASKSFSNCFNAYAKAINKKYNRTGSLFQERFRRKEIADDRFFTKIIGYILTNPVKHRYSKNAAAYPYSAYSSLVSNGPTSLLRDEVIKWFGSKKKFVNYIRSYEQDLKAQQNLTGLKTC